MTEEEKKALEEKQKEDDAFMQSLEHLNEEDEVDDKDDKEVIEEINEEDEEAKKKAEEEQRQKNKNAEEARKRREAEAKAKKEEEEKIKEAEKTLENQKDAQSQVKALVEKYPDLDLAELDKNEDFQEYLQGKWVKGGKTITEIYENFVKFEARLTKKDVETISSQYKKKSGPKITGGSGNGGNGNEVFSKEELEKISLKLPFMNEKEYSKIEEKLNRSITYYKTK